MWKPCCYPHTRVLAPGVVVYFSKTSSLTHKPRPTGPLERNGSSSASAALTLVHALMPFAIFPPIHIGIPVHTQMSKQPAARPVRTTPKEAQNIVHQDAHWRQRVDLEKQTSTQWSSNWGYLAGQASNRITSEYDALLNGLSTSTSYQELNEIAAKCRYTHKFIERFKQDRNAHRSKLPLSAYTATRPTALLAAAGAASATSGSAANSGAGQAGNTEIDQHVPPPKTISFSATQASPSSQQSSRRGGKTSQFTPTYQVVPWKRPQPVTVDSQRVLSVTQSTYGIPPPRPSSTSRRGKPLMLDETKLSADLESLDQVPTIKTANQWDTPCPNTLYPPHPSTQLDTSLAFAMQARLVQTTGGSMRLPGAAPRVKYTYPVTTGQEIGWRVNQPLEIFGTNLSTKPNIPLPAKLEW